MRDTTEHAVLRRAVSRHVLLTALVTVVVSGLVAIGVVVFARQDAYRSAEQVARQVAAAVIVPLSRQNFREPVDPVRAELGGDVEPFLTSGMVGRVKVWTVLGDTARIVYSDEPRVEGETGTLESTIVARLDAGEVLARPVPDDAEHRFEEPSANTLLEVFIGFRDSGGAPARLEVYVPVDQAGTIRDTAAAVLPMLVGGLVLFALATLPLSVALGRRLERERAEQRAVRRYGLAAAEASRRDLARHLHDGVIPELAGASLLLETVRTDESGATGPAGRKLLEDAHDLLTGEVRQLRTLLDGLMPPDPVGHDLGTALRELAGGRRPDDPPGSPQVDVEVTLDAEPSADAALLVYRVTGELLRNARRHARARRIRIEVSPTGGEGIRLIVTDDGAGFDPDCAGQSGHVGLALVRRAVADHGGTLTVASTPGAGTTVIASIPPEPSARRAPSGGGDARTWRDRLRRAVRTH